MNNVTPESSRIDQILNWLYGRINYEHQINVAPRSFKLQNMRELLRLLGNPHEDYAIVHVAGTKGKGSVTSMVGNILSYSGQQTGIYTSPHLESIHQRMVIGNRPISDHQLADVLEMIRPIVEELDRESRQSGRRKVTFFEITTAAALLHFSRQKCDSAVLEVGLGGRLDSTNVCQPAVCVITSISIDHTRQLGSTVEKIAFEKAGIIKPGVPIVSGVRDLAAAEVIRNVAADQDAKLLAVDDAFHWEESDSGFRCHGNLFDADIGKFDLENLKLQMIGSHQKNNAAITVATCQVLSSLGWSLSDSDIRRGLWSTKLPGRTEVVNGNPTFVLDVAHNVASVKVLVKSLKNELKGWGEYSPKILICAFSREKNIGGMLQQLIPHFDLVIITKYQSNPRGVDAKEAFELACAVVSEDADVIYGQKKEQANDRCRILIEETPADALDLALAESGQSFICITGSVFLVAELRQPVLNLAKSSP